MNIILVDDEPLARQELSHLLKAFPECTIIAEAGNISEAAQKIEELKPDLVLLDINMPEGDGFELLERLTFTPAIVFTTAYDQYAIKAFEVNALDYLLKPVDPQRLSQAINKMNATTEPEDNTTQAIEGDQPLTEATKSLKLEEKIFIKDRDRCWLVAVGEIMLLESQGNYTRISFGQSNPMIKRPLSQLEERLPKQHFFRASRKHIVNMRYVTSIDSPDPGQLQLTLQNGQTIAMSRRQSQEFKNFKSL